MGLPDALEGRRLLAGGRWGPELPNSGNGCLGESEFDLRTQAEDRARSAERRGGAEDEPLLESKSNSSLKMGVLGKRKG